jgi:pyrimidine operon attenuation protein/uracil phosphoribosyltransferase
MDAASKMKLRRRQRILAAIAGFHLYSTNLLKFHRRFSRPEQEVPKITFDLKVYRDDIAFCNQHFR